MFHPSLHPFDISVAAPPPFSNREEYLNPRLRRRIHHALAGWCGVWSRIVYARPLAGGNIVLGKQWQQENISTIKNISSRMLPHQQDSWKKCFLLSSSSTNTSACTCMIETIHMLANRARVHPSSKTKFPEESWCGPTTLDLFPRLCIHEATICFSSPYVVVCCMIAQRVEQTNRHVEAVYRGPCDDLSLARSYR